MNEIDCIYKTKFTINRDQVDGKQIKFIPNTNNQYAVSRDGAVYSFSNKMRGKKIGSQVPSGYVTACIKFEDGSKKLMYVHRLVAEAFLTNPEGKKQVAHLNEQRNDNRAENLVYFTAEENCNFGNHNKRLADSVKEFYKNRDSFGRLAKRVKVMDMKGDVLEIAPSIQKAADFISYRTGKSDNSSSVQISAILQGKPGFRTVGGYKVEEATDEEYKQWAANNINKIIQEEDIELSDVQLKKLTKVDGVMLTNRTLNVITGDMEYEVYEFKPGEKVVSELH